MNRATGTGGTRTAGAPLARRGVKRSYAAPLKVQPPGLFDRSREHDACGVGFIVNLRTSNARTGSSRTACAFSRTSSIAAPSAPTR